MSYSTSFITNMADSVAKHVIDDAAVAGSTSAIVTGQTTMLNRIATEGTAADEFPLLDGFESAVALENAWISQETSYNNILDSFLPACAALDRAVGGLQAYLTSNTLQVDPHFLDAFNRAATKGNSYPSTPLKAFNAFGNAVANMGQIAVSGATTGVFSAGTAVNAAYGNAPLSLFNAGVGNTGASPTVATVTYNKYDNAGNLLTGQTATATMPNGSTPGTAVALSGSAAGIAVTNITVTGGNNGDTLAVKSTLLRAVTY